MIAGSSSAVSLSRLQIIEKMASLKPLAKVHYSWGWPDVLLDDPNGRLLYHTARIMNAVSISGHSATAQKVRAAVYTCARLNRTDPDIPLTMGINYSPFHYVLDPNVPPTYRGRTYQDELDRFVSRMVRIKGWLSQSNDYYQSDVRVGAILLDMERFHFQPGNDQWNEGIRTALDAVHNRAQTLFPHARIEWYGRGMRWINGDPPWRQSPYFTGEEKLSSLSCSLYFVPEIERTLELYRRTAELADQLGVQDVTPWVALASGYRRGVETPFYFDLDWDYEVIYSYLIGRYINHSWFGVPERSERFAPFGRAKVVVFYPPPFDPRTPHWGKHFIAYVRGAQSVKRLSDLGGPDR